MKIVCLQENLEKAFALIAKTLANKTQLPLTTSALLQAKKQEIILSGTDLESTAQVTIPGKVLEEGGILLPTRTCIEIINSLPKEQVEIEVKELIATIQSGAYRIKINGISPDEFPQPPKGNEKIKIKIQDILRYGKEVAFAAANDESRASLTGVLVLFQKDEITLVATDGYRLSLKKINVPKRKTGEENGLEKIIIPGRMFSEVAKMVGSHDEGKESTLSLTDMENQVVFHLDDIVIYTRLIEGEFPVFEKIIPQSSDTRVTFDKEEFVKAVKLSSIFARESSNIIQLKISKKEITLSANAPQVGENTCEVEANITGDENEIAFNARFLLDFLATVDAKEIAFEMTGPLNPGVFKIPGDNSYLHIIMPVRVQ